MKNKNISFQTLDIPLTEVWNTFIDQMCITDSEGVVIDANEAFCKSFSIAKQNLLGKPFTIILHPTQQMKVMEIYRANFQNKVFQGPIEKLFHLHNNQYFYLEHVAFKFEYQGEQYALNVFHDTTDSKKTKLELEQSINHYRQLYQMLRLMCDNVPDWIFAKDLQKRYLFANRAICDELLSAKDTNEPIGKDDMFFANRERSKHPDNPNWHTFGEICQNSDDVILQIKKPKLFDEFGYVKGEFIEYEVHKAPLLDENNNMIGIVGAGRNITEFKKQQEALQKLHQQLVESERNLQIVTETIPSLELWFSPSKHILYISPSCTSITGYTTSDFGNSVTFLHNLVAPEHQKVFDEYFSGLFDVNPLNNTEPISYSELEYKIITKTKEEKWVLHTSRRVFGQKGEFLGVRSSIIDITSQKNLEFHLYNQLKHLQLLNKVIDIVFYNTDKKAILAQLAETIGITFEIERVLFYEVNFEKDKVLVLTECCFLSKAIETSDYPLKVFRTTTETIQDSKTWLESHYDNINPALVKDKADEILHKQKGIKSLLWYPVYFTERGYYLLIFNQFSGKREWKKGELELLESIRNYLSLSFQKIEYLEKIESAKAETDKHLEELQLISDFTNLIYRIDTIQDLFKTTISSILRILNADRASLLLYDDDGVVRFKAWHNLSDKYRSLVEGHTPWARTQTDAKPIYVEDIDNSDIEPHLKSIIKGEGIRSLGFIPIIGDKELYGKFMIYFDSVHNFNEDEDYLAKALAAQFSIAYTKNKNKEALAESEKRYRYLFEISPVGIMILDKEGHIVKANKTISQILGYDIKELEGLDIRNVVPPEDKGRIERDIEKIMRDGFYEHQVTNKRKDGNLVYLNLVETPITITSGNDGILSIAVDITEKRLYEEQIIKLSTAVEQSPFSIVVTDINGYIEYANEATSKVSQYEKDELIGAKTSIFKSGLTPVEVYKQMWSTIKAGNVWGGELCNRKKNGEYYWEFINIAPIVDREGKIKNFIAIKTDITSRKILEETLIETKNKLEKSDQLKTVFLNNISHEIRTPLNGIIGFADLLADPHLSQAEREEYVKDLKVSGERLLLTIQSYVDIAQIVSKTMQPFYKFFNPASIIYSLVERFERICVKKTLERKLSIPDNLKRIEIFSDPELIQKALFYLLDNAIKFTAQGIIEIGLIENNEKLTFFIRDTGIGIPKEKLDSIFELFTQVSEGPAKTYEGSGVGLSIVKGIANLLNSELIVESEPGKGSTFYFAIPYDFKKHIIPIQETTYVSRPEHKVLIVEDERLNYLFLKKALEKIGVNIIYASNGIDAIKAVKENPDIALILMDLKMPKMDGYEATKQIRSFQEDIPIIAVSAYAMGGDERKAIEAGCNDYITKPFETEILLKKLREYGIMEQKS
ncbi:MAG: PAS domain S-box protein [Ignavibacteria bacterium]